jgi:hypothetical protein
MFIMKRYLYETPSNPILVIIPDPLQLDACLAIASKIADEIHILAGNGELEIMQDTASCMTSSLVVFLRKVSRSLLQALNLLMACRYFATQPRRRKRTSSLFSMAFS